MTNDTAKSELETAMESLRKRGFMRTPPLSPRLMELLQLDPSTPPDTAREYVRRRLIATADQLDPTLRTAFLVVGGLRPDAPLGTGERLAQAAGQLRVSERTARRRFEEATEQIVPILLSTGHRSVLPEIDYSFVHVRTRFDLRDETPYIVNERTISVRSDGIDHVDERIGLPRFNGDNLLVRALEGCKVDHARKVGMGIWDVRLSFPRRLRTGDRHSFATSFELPGRDALDPIAGFLPHTVSYDASVELLFGDRRPAALERFVSPPLMDSSTSLPDSELIEPVQAHHDFAFNKMQPGLCYGVRWRWDDQGTQSASLQARQ